MHLHGMTEALKYRAEDHAVQGAKVIHVAEEPTVVVARSHDPLANVVIRVKGLLDVALGWQAVVVEEENLQVLVVQAFARSQPPDVLQRSALVAGAAYEVGRHHDDSVGALIPGRGGRLGDDPNPVWEIEAVSPNRVDDRVDRLLVSYGRDLNDHFAGESHPQPTATDIPDEGHAREHDGHGPCGDDYGLEHRLLVARLRQSG
jgi:hypothetical protein